MPTNPGRNPFEGNDSPPLVDVKYRCGVIARCVEPHKRRWKQWPEGPHGWDIVSYQLSTGKDYEVVWPVPKADETGENPRKSAA